MGIKNATRIQKIRYYAAVRWIIYILLILTSAVLMNVGRGVKPIYFIPLCLCICMYEGEYPAAVLGGVCGLLIDASCGRIFGYSSLFMIIFCVAAVLLFKHLLLQNFMNIVLLTAACATVYQLIDYFFMYAMWDYEGSGYVFRHISVPCIIYTVISAVPVYLLVRPVQKRFYPKKAKTAEAAMKL
ncbi:MAG: rod shape-determining protein MreD [Porcipelethomonas sp.]